TSFCNLHASILRMLALNSSLEYGISLIQKLYIEPERAHFLHQHVEAFWDARLEIVLAAHDGLVDLRATRNVVRLDGEDFLQRVGGAVGFERPHLHFAKALAAELRLATQRLLSHETVRADGARVDL